MKKTRNISPVGWYVGSYVLRFIELSEQGNCNPNRRFPTWENTVLVQARSLNNAYDKVAALAKKNTKPYKGGPAPGVEVQWVFEGVTELLPIYDELKDGAEIMWANHPPRALKTIRSWVRNKKEFNSER